MDPTDPSNAVQPEAGQGDGGQEGTPPYAEYLSRIPEDARGPAEEAFKAWDANYTRHQQEASQFKKQWEPYQELGVHQLPPDDVAWALQFRQAAAENPQAVRDWYDQYAQQHGLIDQPPPPADDLGFQDPNAQQLEQMLTSKLSPLEQKLEQFSQWQQQQETAARENEAKQFIGSQIEELKAKHPDDFKDKSDYGAEKMVERFLGQYIETDPMNAVPKAFADYQAFRGQIEKATLQPKVDDPPPPEGGGVPNATAETPSFRDAGQQAVAALRAMNNG